jgi:hypothetical protein
VSTTCDSCYCKPELYMYWFSTPWVTTGYFR